jgi:hypothetical protein
VECRDCARFNEETRECRDKKVNPQTWSEAVEVANYLGVRSICMMNDHRERLVDTRIRTVSLLPKREQPLDVLGDHVEFKIDTVSGLTGGEIRRG